MTEINYGSIKTGQTLPDLQIEITPRLVAGGAIASRDYQAVHHDYHAAKKTGTEDIFMNILTTNGLVGRYVSDWVGADAVLRSVNIRLGTPNYPGDTMVLSGEVKSKDTDKDVGEIVLDIKGKNSSGYHVTGTVTLAMPVTSACEET